MSMTNTTNRSLPGIGGAIACSRDAREAAEYEEARADRRFAGWKARQAREARTLELERQAATA